MNNANWKPPRRSLKKDVLLFTLCFEQLHSLLRGALRLQGKGVWQEPSFPARIQPITQWRWRQANCLSAHNVALALSWNRGKELPKINGTNSQHTEFITWSLLLSPSILIPRCCSCFLFHREIEAIKKDFLPLPSPQILGYLSVPGHVYPTSSPVLQTGLSSGARPRPLLWYWPLSPLTYWRTSLQQRQIVANWSNSYSH